MLRRSLSALTAALLLSASPAHAQGATSNAISLDDAFDWLRVTSTQAGLVALRLFADIRYGDVNIVPGTGAVLVSDIEATIPLPYAPPRSCTVTIGAYEGRQSALALLTGLLGMTELRMSDVVVPLECLPPPALATAQMAQLTEIVIDELRLQTEYDVPSASADVALRLSARDLADVELRGEIDYAFALLQPPTEERLRSDPDAEPEPVPSIEFGDVDITIADRGLVERATPFLNMSGVSREQLPAILADGVRSGLGAVPLADELEREVERFLSEGGRLSIALRPDELWLSQVQDMDPATAVAAFNPSVGRGPRPTLLSAELLASAAGPGVLPPEDAMQIARAQLSGEGMPRDPAGAFETIRSYASTYDAPYGAEAREIAARALLASGDRADDAYRYAIEAGAEGRSVGDLLRRAEANLEPSAILEAQRLAFTQWEGTPEAAAVGQQIREAIASADTAAFLDLARRHERGVGVPRNIATAFALALLADAGGEIGARRLVSQIEAMADASDAARATWGPVVSESRQEATTAWLQGGVAAALARRQE